MNIRLSPGASRSRPRLLLLALLAAVTLAGCGTTSGARSNAAGSRRHGELTVLAAASLTEAFTTLARAFETDHPGVEVRLAFDSSATLAEQVAQGAPADVLATADEATMSTVVDAGLTQGTPRVFATNHLRLVVPRQNPAGIRRLADLDRPGVTFVVCVDSAPCGRLATSLLQDAGVTAKPASEEVDVKAVLSKVQLDEADAGLVYASDAVAAGSKVRAIDVPATPQNRTSYPIAALSDARTPALARAWLDLVTSPRGRRVLADAGFGKP